jgi:AraC family transcriptional activator of pobA
MRDGNGIPTFFLYGEPARDSGARHLHIEPLALRSRPANWTIRPHAHTALSQIFALTSGGGEMQADGRRITFAAPCLLLIPSRVVHAFAYDSGATGRVLTLGDSYLAELRRREPALSGLFASALATRCGPQRDARRLDMLLRQLGAELSWQAPGHESAVEALLMMSLVLVARSLQQFAGPVAGSSRESILVAQFRAMVEARFRERLPLAAYLASLGVSETRLRQACALVAGQPPLQLIQERTMLEAKRMLLYSNNSCAEIAYRLGFHDPAYFSRFFHAAAGTSAREFRRNALSAPHRRHAPSAEAPAAPLGARAD